MIFYGEKVTVVIWGTLTLLNILVLGVWDGVITHGQRGTDRPPPGGGGYELWVKDHNLGIMDKVSYESWT